MRSVRSDAEVHMNDKPTRPSSETRAAERDEAKRPAGAGRDATPEEAERADDHDLGPDVAEHVREMNERGANQEGEGRLP
jgi:hypothetical protein